MRLRRQALSLLGEYVGTGTVEATPADLPIAGATQFTFSASRSALEKLGLSLPSDISARVNDWLD